MMADGLEWFVGFAALIDGGDGCSGFQFHYHILMGLYSLLSGKCIKLDWFKD